MIFPFLWGQVLKYQFFHISRPDPTTYFIFLLTPIRPMRPAPKSHTAAGMGTFETMKLSKLISGNRSYRPTPPDANISVVSVANGLVPPFT